jgi:predicted phage-related endonuclease
MFENMKGYEMIGFVPKITQVEIKLVESTGKEEVIIFNQKELENIKEMKNLKNELLKLEESKKELNRKVNNARNELAFIENMEVI